jgi:RNA polymerase sigma-70 factor (ECF subfamily)
MAAFPLPASHDRRMSSAGPAPKTVEHELVLRAQRGDVAAFEELYRASSGRVFALCLRMSRDRTRATELLQDVFVRVWEKLGLYRGDASFTTWLHRLAVNVVLEAERREKRRNERYDDDGDGSGETVTGLARSDSVDERMDLQQAITALPPGARRVFVLHDVEGFQHNEIAQMTGLAEGTLRAQLHRARKLLMEALNR